jgi:hypothetical protein
MILLPFFLKYLLLPLVALVVVIPIAWLKKKNESLDNKTLIVFVLVSSLLVGVPGLWGMVGDEFSPVYYAIAQALYGLGGIFYVKVLIRHLSPKITAYQQLLESLLTLVIMLLGMFLFSLLYNALSPVPNGVLASSCALVFAVPLLFYWTYLAYISIPLDIYKLWRYDATQVDSNRLDGVDFNKLLVLELEFGRKVNDEDRTRVKVKALPEMYFGEWFGTFLENYNRKFPDNPIAAAKDSGEAHDWIFYVKPSFFSRRRYIDPEASVATNRIREKHTIITKRVSHEQI